MLGNLKKKLNIKKNIIILGSFIALSSCSALVPTGSETFKFLGIAKGVGDLTLYAKTGKTVNDHILSAAVKKDCKLGRIIQKRPICIELDPSTQKFSIFNKGKVVSKNNVIKMKFPSEVYDLNNSLEQNVRKTLKNSNLRLIF
ncbi:MAG: hypothetical protein CMI97_02785 [Pelagibacteraceae bacterium]|jgi:hypothetical protein|nr:hypothetical protein [Pelagibacteraceae bacterium]PPR32704.1 MAG: hypothetical protein CFH27_01160 [Alphaproteobacteria bacterium MarineAlpha6_Bin5]|tara:strand:+ start:1141 stop:1569 length:429 start_codon:yes stop_codon:yes gene_type:complete